MVRCPLTGKVMKNPICVHGVDYDKKALMDYVAKNQGYDPKARLVEDGDIVPSSDLVQQLCMMYSKK